MVSIRRGSAKRFCFEESSRVPYHAASPYCGLLWANLIQALLFLLPHLLVLHHAADMALTSDYLFGDLVPRLGASQVWFDTLPLDGSCFCQCGHMSKHCCPFNDVIQFNAIADWRAGQTVFHLLRVRARARDDTTRCLLSSAYSTRGIRRMKETPQTFSNPGRFREAQNISGLIVLGTNCEIRSREWRNSD